jgi:uncharacterized membrane protein
MDALQFLQPYDLHPVIDHFSVALLITGVVIDLVASLFPLRSWIRYTALLLMILGAISAGASYATGDLEADRVWNALGDPAKAVLHRHAMLAQYAAIAFAVLAVWRILIEGVGVFAGTRSIYLILAVIAVGVLGYIGHLGGVLVYTYGTGTALMAAEPSPTATPAIPGLPALPGPLPTVTIPTALPTSVPPAVMASPAPSAEPSQSAKPAASPSPSASPTAAGV